MGCERVLSAGSSSFLSSSIGFFDGLDFYLVMISMVSFVSLHRDSKSPSKALLVFSRLMMNPDWGIFSICVR